MPNNTIQSIAFIVYSIYVVAISPYIYNSHNPLSGLFDLGTTVSYCMVIFSDDDDNDDGLMSGI